MEFSVVEYIQEHARRMTSRVPKCVILAAGTATRLRPLTDTVPKCLLKVGEKSLLDRTLENVFAAGINEVALVVGYRRTMIHDFVKHAYPQKKIRFIFNPNFERTNNAYSLLLARRFMEEQGEIINRSMLLLDSDILFSVQLLPHLLHADAENKIAVRVSGEHNAEEIQVEIKFDGSIGFIGKKSDCKNTDGESIGVEVFSPATAGMLFATLERRVREGSGRTEFYEAAFQEMIDRGVVLQAVDVSSFPAIEIDTPEDLSQAERLRMDI
jgi:choline kinase